MADAVTSQTLQDGPRNVVMKLTNLSDGTGESAALKVDVSTLTTYQGKTCTGVKLKKIHYNVSGMVATLLWDATTDVTIVDLAGYGTFDFTENELSNNAGTGVTGDILLTTTGHTSGDNYTLILEMVKKYV